MGSACSGEKDLNQDGFDPDQEDDFEDLDVDNVPPPSPDVAYNIDNLPSTEMVEGKLTRLQQQINTMKANERKGKKYLQISRTQPKGSHISNPYKIRCMEAIYIGQWKYNANLLSTVPGGIGRLYTVDQIYEGQMVCKIDDKQKYKGQFEEDIADMMIRQNKKRAKFFNKDKQQLESKATDNQRNIQIILEGHGRIFSRTKQLQGFFKNGQLHGKGEMEIKYDKDVYSYKGQFIEGKKHGKGIQKFKGTTYDGQFNDDLKEGRGYLVLFISNKFQKEQEAETKKIQQQNSGKDPAKLITLITDFIGIRKAFDSKIEEALKEFPWVYPDKIKTQPFIYNPDFLLQHSRKTKFTQHYRGIFKNNEFDGFGKYVWFNGKAYEGEWKEGKMDGHGQFYWQKQGQFYEGQYQNDLKHGKGTIYWNLTKRYRGSWAFGLRHGYGQLISVDKIISDQAVGQSMPIQPPKKKSLFDLLQGEDKATAKLTITGALFNKDKIMKQLWVRQKIVKVNVNKMIQKQKEMICRIKGIRYDPPIDGAV